MNSNTVVENLIGVFLTTDLDNFKIHMLAVEKEIRDNHISIVKYLQEIGVDENLIDLVKNELKV